MNKLNLHHKGENKKEMFRCPECKADTEYAKWTRVKNKEGFSRCPKCKKELKETQVKKVA
jgi:uncharacterized protein with PIN domain